MSMKRYKPDGTIVSYDAVGQLTQIKRIARPSFDTD
jgi:hypothetical protein